MNKYYDIIEFEVMIFIIIGVSVRHIPILLICIGNKPFTVVVFYRYSGRHVHLSMAYLNLYTLPWITHNTQNPLATLSLIMQCFYSISRVVDLN